jgi:muscarinic acetylcholine receptor M3
MPMTNFLNVSDYTENDALVNATTLFDNSIGFTSWNAWKIILVFIAFSLAMITIIGNVLVLESFRVNKQLRTISNYFLFSLAIADLTIGLISIPIYTAYFITEKWLLGPFVCDMWLSIDYTMSNASVANLLLISFDRYFSVTHPLTYRAKRTSNKAVLLIASGWLISFLLWTPVIISWPYIYGKRTISNYECKVQFLDTNKYLTLRYLVFFIIYHFLVSCYRVFDYDSMEYSSE